MSGFWSICCFSLKTKYQQHNPQSLCNKSFCPSIVSFGSVVLIPEGAQEVICQPLPESSPLLQQGPRLRDCSWCFGQRRVPGVALVGKRGARSVRSAAPRRGPRLPRGSSTVTAAGGVGGPGALGSGRISQCTEEEEGGEVKQRRGQEDGCEKTRGIPGR